MSNAVLGHCAECRRRVWEAAGGFETLPDGRVIHVPAHVCALNHLAEAVRALVREVSKEGVFKGDGE